jgi:hypothetical protein
MNLWKCANGHYFVNVDVCPICGANDKTPIEMRDGDCVACGVLCGKGLYGCNSPDPLEDPVTPA